VNRRTARAVQSQLVAPPFTGSNGEDPQVSSVSRFHDEEWDFSNEDRNPSATVAAKKIRWPFRMPGGGLFTDPPWRSLLTASKQFIYAMRWHPLDGPPSAPQSLANLFGALKPFIAHLASQGNPILRFKDVLPHHCEDYIEGILGSTLSAARKYHLLHVVEKLFQYRQLVTDGLMADPFQGRLARRIAGYSHAIRLEGQTQAIPDEILGPLVRASLDYVDRLADYLLDACEAVEDIRERKGSFEYWPRRWAREHPPAAYGLDGTRLENGLSSVRHLNRELCYLQAACFVLIAFSTGMRVSEILALQVGCCEIQKEPGQADLVWLRSRVFKFQGYPRA